MLFTCTPMHADTQKTHMHERKQLIINKMYRCVTSLTTTKHSIKKLVDLNNN